MVTRRCDESIANTDTSAHAEKGEGVSLEIKVGPPQLAIHQGHAVLLSELDGQINWPSEKGLYFYDTRVELAPGGTWHSCLAYDLSNDSQRLD